MSIASYVDKIRTSRVDDLFMVSARSDNRACWFYVHIEKAKAPFFEKAISNLKVMELAQYGQILVSGWGETPPEKVKEKIKAEGLNFRISEKESAPSIFYVTNSHEGRAYYAFVAVPNYLGDEFNHKCMTGPVNFNDYGSVIISDWGKPTENVLKMLELEYEFDRSSIVDSLTEV